ncbi:MAG: endonuclease Q family protein [Spirochaetia bacterium]|nr:endonuclease Q family protein [Spirochaetia bacterium]
MKIIVDLHSHSPYAGASGKSDFQRLSYVMQVKGIDVYGSGDILLEKWEDELNGAFRFDPSRSFWVIRDGQYLIPQTEIIVTLPYEYDISKRKLFHVVIIFAELESVRTVRKMMLARGSKLGIGRPFVKFDSCLEMQEFFAEMKKLADVVIVPAHVVTPDGILGGKNPVDSISEIWGQQTELVDALESGLSADPDMLSGIAGSLGIPVISSSDAHSAAFNRLGREFTLLDIEECSASGVLAGIRDRKVLKTAEFPPFEGRYYLTGHRGDRPGHDGEDVFFIDDPPEICPVCGKHFVEGVRQRIRRISPAGNFKRQDFVYQIPLIEIIAESLGCGCGSGKAVRLYEKITGQIGRESNIWFDDGLLGIRDVPDEVLEGIIAVKENRFRIKYGFDGQYGQILL